MERIGFIDASTRSTWSSVMSSAFAISLELGLRACCTRSSRSARR
jgi:hypothetical protein